MEPTSEQELKQLLEEGKITQEEHQELLEAIRQKETTEQPVEKANEPKSRTGYGKAALFFMIAGFVQVLVVFLFALLLGRFDVRFGTVMLLPSLLIGFLFEMLAFIFGIIGWKTNQGKFAAIGVPVFGLSALLLVPLVPLLLAIIIPVFRAEQVRTEHEHELHRSYSLDSMEGVLTQDRIEYDDAISADGNGSLKIVADSAERTVIRLIETGPIGIENCMLIYSAQLKSELEDGKAYLEMWCDIPGKGEFFSRSIETPIMKTTEWTTVQTPFRLEAGQSPATVKLNLVVEGLGTVWVDDIKLLSSPLH